MHYLIDGHNLIAYLPDIHLDDPDDEVKLVMKLRQFATRSRKKVTVVFDGGLPGGVSKELSTSQVRVKFASAAGMSADRILLNTIHKTKNVREVVLVSSDREIVEQAQHRKIQTMTAIEFMAVMHPPVEAAQVDEKDDNPRISKAEVEDWLRIFSQHE